VKWWLPLVYLLILAAAYLLGRTTAPRPEPEVITDTVYVERIVQPPPSSRIRPAPEQLRIERPSRSIETDTIRIRVPVGVTWQGIIAPRPIHLEPGRVVLTYWHYPSGTWRQEVYRTLPPRERTLSAYMVLRRHFQQPDIAWEGGVGLELRRGRIGLALEATNAGISTTVRVRVWPR